MLVNRPHFSATIYLYFGKPDFYSLHFSYSSILLHFEISIDFYMGEGLLSNFLFRVKSSELPNSELVTLIALVVF